MPLKVQRPIELTVTSTSDRSFSAASFHSISPQTVILSASLRNISTQVPRKGDVFAGCALSKSASGLATQVIADLVTGYIVEATGPLTNFMYLPVSEQGWIVLVAAGTNGSVVVKAIVSWAVLA